MNDPIAILRAADLCAKRGRLTIRNNTGTLVSLVPEFGDSAEMLAPTQDEQQALIELGVVVIGAQRWVLAVGFVLSVAAPAQTARSAGAAN